MAGERACLTRVHPALGPTQTGEQYRRFKRAPSAAVFIYVPATARGGWKSNAQPAAAIVEASILENLRNGFGKG